MSEENVVVAREANAAFNRQGVDGLLDYCAADIRWRTTERFPDGGTYVGHDGVRRVFAELEADLERLQFAIEEVRDAGDWVVSIGRLTGHGRASAAPVDSFLCFSGHIMQGKYVAVQTFLDPDEALKAVGLAE